MKRSDQKRASRQKVVNAAARLIRQRGAKRTSVADVMEAAGMTHGGFYAHFDSKDQLIAEGLARATEHREKWLSLPAGGIEADRIAEIAQRYLNPAHRARPAGGCPYPAMMSESGDAGGRIAGSLREETRRTADMLARQLDDGVDLSADEKAWALLAMFVGAMQLSRWYSGAEGEAIMSAARRLAVRAAEPSGGPGRQRRGPNKQDQGERQSHE